MELIDTHAHLDEPAFEVDRDDVVARALSAGVAAVVTIGTTAASSRDAASVAQKYPSVYAAVGIQPNYVAEAADDDWNTIVELARAPKVVAIGETGLDRYWDHAPIELQARYFDMHIELSRECGLPFVVHCRDAAADMVSQLQRAAAGRMLRGVMHSFTGDAAMARACLDLGLHISFAGMLTYKKNDDLRAVAGSIPLDRLLVETDSPYLAPTPNRGKRNEPAFVTHTAACLAELHRIDMDELAAHTSRNARALFGID